MNGELVERDASRIGLWDWYVVGCQEQAARPALWVVGETDPSHWHSDGTEGQSHCSKLINCQKREYRVA